MLVHSVALPAGTYGFQASLKGVFLFLEMEIAGMKDHCFLLSACIVPTEALSFCMEVQGRKSTPTPSSSRALRAGTWPLLKILKASAKLISPCVFAWGAMTACRVSAALTKVTPSTCVAVLMLSLPSGSWNHLQPLPRHSGINLIAWKDKYMLPQGAAGFMRWPCSRILAASISGGRLYTSLFG